MSSLLPNSGHESNRLLLFISLLTMSGVGVGVGEGVAAGVAVGVDSGVGAGVGVARLRRRNRLLPEVQVLLSGLVI